MPPLQSEAGGTGGAEARRRGRGRGEGRGKGGQGSSENTELSLCLAHQIWIPKSIILCFVLYFFGDKMLCS